MRYALQRQGVEVQVGRAVIPSSHPAVAMMGNLGHCDRIGKVQRYERDSFVSLAECPIAMQPCDPMNAHTCRQ